MIREYRDRTAVITAAVSGLGRALPRELAIRKCNVALIDIDSAVASDHTYRFLIHDRDSIFSVPVDNELKAFGLKVLRTPVQAPKANCPYRKCHRARTPLKSARFRM